MTVLKKEAPLKISEKVAALKKQCLCWSSYSKVVSISSFSKHKANQKLSQHMRDGKSPIKLVIRLIYIIFSENFFHPDKHSCKISYEFLSWWSNKENN